VIFPAEYSWLNSYLDNDTLWLESSLNWEDAFSILINDFTIYSFLTTPFFINSHFFLDSFTKISFIDIIFLSETNKHRYSRELYDLFIWDISTSISNKYFPAQFFFYTDYQDFVAIALQYSPEIVIALESYLNTFWLNAFFNSTPSVVFDIFNDSTTSTVAEFTEYLSLLFLFVWLMIFIVNVFSLSRWSSIIEPQVARVHYYMYSSSRESRVQFEAFILTFFFFFFFWTLFVVFFYFFY